MAVSDIKGRVYFEAVVVVRFCKGVYIVVLIKVYIVEGI
jgi:hypothetical protein